MNDLTVRVAATAPAPSSHAPLSRCSVTSCGAVRRTRITGRAFGAPGSGRHPSSLPSRAREWPRVTTPRSRELLRLNRHLYG
jgi:hypothetical protein